MIVISGMPRDISCILTGHANWGLFASMFPCLWGEVAERLSTKDDRAQALALVKSEDFPPTVQSFRRTKGIAPHPAVHSQAKTHPRGSANAPARDVR